MSLPATLVPKYRAGGTGEHALHIDQWGVLQPCIIPFSYITGELYGYPTGPAGGHLTGTYPNPSIANKVIAGQQKFANGAVTDAKIANGTLTNEHLVKRGIHVYGSGDVRARGSGLVTGALTPLGNTITVTVEDTLSAPAGGPYVLQSEFDPTPNARVLSGSSTIRVAGDTVSAPYFRRGDVTASALATDTFASGNVGAAYGWGSEAAFGSTAAGIVATATAVNSVAVGNSASATGAPGTEYQVAVGSGSAATNTGAVAIGGGTASAVNSTAVGMNSTASAAGATAIGLFAKADQTNASAIGYRATVRMPNETSFGNARFQHQRATFRRNVYRTVQFNFPLSLNTITFVRASICANRPGLDLVCYGSWFDDVIVRTGAVAADITLINSARAPDDLGRWNEGFSGLWLGLDYSGIYTTSATGVVYGGAPCLQISFSDNTSPSMATVPSATVDTQQSTIIKMSQYTHAEDWVVTAVLEVTDRVMA